MVIFVTNVQIPFRQGVNLYFVFLFFVCLFSGVRQFPQLSNLATWLLRFPVSETNHGKFNPGRGSCL